MIRRAPHVSIITTPVEEDGGVDDVKNGPFTPSPQAVDELDGGGTPAGDAVTSANRSAVVSRMLSDHLITISDDEVIVSSSAVNLPELYPHGNVAADDQESVCTNSNVQQSPGGFSLGTPGSNFPPLNDSNRRTPPTPVQRKMLYQSLRSMASPVRGPDDDYPPRLDVGPEREVRFHTDSLGIKISRHTDGYVRVLSVTPYRSSSIMGKERVREGDIHEGDVVREVSDVDLRMPIDSAVWKLTVGLIKMAPRPLKFVVARELQILVDEDEEEGRSNCGGGDDDDAEADSMRQHRPPHVVTSARMDNVFGPAREVHFFEPCLGVKLHHNSAGYVQILSVTPYMSFPDSPVPRTGEMREGDVVLEVGGVWDLREPIGGDLWAALIQYIRETRRPLSMILADAECLQTESDEEEEERRGEESDADSADSHDDMHRKRDDDGETDEASVDSKNESFEEEEEEEHRSEEVDRSDTNLDDDRVFEAGGCGGSEAHEDASDDDSTSESARRRDRSISDDDVRRERVRGGGTRDASDDSEGEFAEEEEADRPGERSTANSAGSVDVDDRGERDGDGDARDAADDSEGGSIEEEVVDRPYDEEDDRRGETANARRGTSDEGGGEVEGASGEGGGESSRRLRRARHSALYG